MSFFYVTERIQKIMKLKIKPSYKYKIGSQEEMQSFLHMKRKGASKTKNAKVYSRKEKHRNSVK